MDEDEEEETGGPLVLLSSEAITDSEEAELESQYRCEVCRKCEDCRVLLSSRTKPVNESEEAGSKIDYRCERCRSCTECKKGEFTHKISLKEEFEQDLIQKSVRVDFNNNETTALLPFIGNPETKLCSNEEESLKVYKQQMKLLAKKPGLKQGALEMEANLQKEGYVEWVANLNERQIKMLNEFLSRYYMPWRLVSNENSVSTPTRIVFDASSITKSGYSLNDILAKGIKSLNSLLEIFIAFRLRFVAVHSDVKKMYNRIKLRPEHWTYQRYWWHPTLDPNCTPMEKIIMTLIYGVTSSGNQAEFALRETARMLATQYPEAARALIKHTYMDDILTGADDMEAAEKLTSDIDAVTLKGGFSTKGYTISGKPP